MESLDYHQIRDYCRTAVFMSEEMGVHEGLSFLIGEKFYSLLQALKQAESKVQFLYEAGDLPTHQSTVAKSGNREIQEGYLLAIQNNYEKALETIKDLRQLRDDFIEEIQEAFEVEDILDYLETYPRFGVGEPQSHIPGSSMDDEPPMELDGLISEIDDIYLVEEIKKFFKKK